MSSPGTLYGLGVGPGDPELITVKALRVLRACPVVLYPAPENGESLARAIAAPHSRSTTASRSTSFLISPLRTARSGAIGESGLNRSSRSLGQERPIDRQQLGGLTRPAENVQAVPGSARLL